MVKGSSHNLCKVGNKRRRTKAQIKEDKRQAILKEQEQQDAMEELLMLRQQIRDKELQAQENQASAQVIKHMLQTGAAKLGDGGGITVQPAQSAFEYGILA